MKSGFFHNIPHVRATVPTWQSQFPYAPDKRFNYWRLLDRAKGGKTADGFTCTPNIGKAPGTGKKVAIIGGGVAGLTAARELVRSGYHVTLLEASSRIGGRLYTEAMSSDYTAIEYGAMRMPFFGEVKSRPNDCSQNSLLSYYLFYDQFDHYIEKQKTYALASPFPNPGAADGGTGVYINHGYGPNHEYSSPTLIAWDKGKAIANSKLDEVATIAQTFVANIIKIVQPLYNNSSEADWKKLWQKIANNYDKMTFSDLVYAENILSQGGYKSDGWFGGMGCTDEQAELLFTVGTGDGSWGAFYAVGAMWWLRCSVFGFTSNLQTVSGLQNAGSLPYHPTTFSNTLKDRAGTKIERPNYRGIQSLCELLLFLVPPNHDKPANAKSLYDNTEQFDFYVDRPVHALEKTSSGINVKYKVGSSEKTLAVDHVIVTAPIWAVQTSIDFQGFTKEQMPDGVYHAMDQQHLISSCKVFYPLKETYWVKSSAVPKPLPQIIVSDAAIQDVYGVKWAPPSGEKEGKGAILASYTWEDDAIKLLPYDQKQLSAVILEELDAITMSTTGVKLSQYIDSSKPFVMRWELQPTYHGCSKLYRQRDWIKNNALISYNQECSNKSRVYFAGESYGVEGGWAEPALMGAIDAVIWLISNSGGTFNNGFSLNDYPKFDASFSPNEKYPQKGSV